MILDPDNKARPLESIWPKPKGEDSAAGKFLDEFYVCNELLKRRGAVYSKKVLARLREFVKQAEKDSRRAKKTEKNA